MPVRNHRKIQLQAKAIKPSVLHQTTDKAGARWHHEEMCNFTTFKIEKEEEK